MKPRLPVLLSLLILLDGPYLASCRKSEHVGNTGAPPAVKVEKEQDVSLLSVDHPEQFALVKAAEYLPHPPSG